MAKSSENRAKKWAIGKPIRQIPAEYAVSSLPSRAPPIQYDRKNPKFQKCVAKMLIYYLSCPSMPLNNLHSDSFRSLYQELNEFMPVVGRKYFEKKLKLWYDIILQKVTHSSCLVWFG